MLVTIERRFLRVLLLAALLTGCQQPSEIANAAQKSRSAQPGQPSVPVTEQRRSSENSDLRIVVTLRSAIVRLGKSNTVVMTMVYQGTGSLYVPDPMDSTEAVALDVRLPSGNSLLVRYPPFIPGVAPRRLNAELQPGVQQKFEMDLDSVLPLDTPGIYKLRVEYPWKVDETWRSPWLTFTVR